jgi:hypothetical protein
MVYYRQQNGPAKLDPVDSTLATSDRKNRSFFEAARVESPQKWLEPEWTL